MVFQQAYRDENKGVKKYFTCSDPSGFSPHWDLRTLAAKFFLPSRQQNGRKEKKKKKDFSGEPDQLKVEEKYIKRFLNKMRQPDCLAVNPMVDKSLSSPSLSPTHNIQAAFKMLHS